MRKLFLMVAIAAASANAVPLVDEDTDEYIEEHDLEYHEEEAFDEELMEMEKEEERNYGYNGVPRAGYPGQLPPFMLPDF